jgi:hypothetical protein
VPVTGSASGIEAKASIEAVIENEQLKLTADRTMQSALVPAGVEGWEPSRATLVYDCDVGCGGYGDRLLGLASTALIASMFRMVLIASYCTALALPRTLLHRLAPPSHLIPPPRTALAPPSHLPRTSLAPDSTALALPRTPSHSLLAPYCTCVAELRHQRIQQPSDAELSSIMGWAA